MRVGEPEYRKESQGLRRLQAEQSEEITVVERHFVVKRRRRQKYRCGCNASVVTAPAPPKLIPGGRYAPEFAVEVAINKYLDDLPLKRQSLYPVSLAHPKP